MIGLQAKVLTRISHRLSAAKPHLAPSQGLPLRGVLNVLSSTLPRAALHEDLDLTQSASSRDETR